MSYLQLENFCNSHLYKTYYNGPLFLPEALEVEEIINNGYLKPDKIGLGPVSEVQGYYVLKI